MPALEIDGVDTTTFGFTLAEPRGFRAGPPKSWSSERPPAAVEALLLNTRPSYGKRDLILIGWLAGATVSELTTRFDELAWRLHPGINGTGEVEIELGDRPNKFYIARHVDTDPQSFERDALGMLVQPVAITLERLKPFLYGPSSSVSGISSSPVDIPGGTAPFTGRFRISGAATNPVITLRDHTGAAVKTTSFTITLGAGAWLDVDLRPGVTKPLVDDGGANQVGALDLDSDFPWTILPEYRDAIAPAEATLELSSGSGEFFYRVADVY